jgi:hypothetical protein
MSASPRELADLEFAKLGDPNVPARLKRLAGTVALLALVFAVVGIVLLLFTWNGRPALRNITLATPPSPVAASLSFFAIGLGVVAFWAVKQMPNKKGVRVMGIGALVLGLVGPPIYTAQAFKIHVQLEVGERDKVTALTRAALDFRAAQKRLPADILELVQWAHLTPDAMKTTFGSNSKLAGIPDATRKDAEYAGILRQFEDQSDFVYLAGNIDKAESSDGAAKLIVARSKYTHLESQSAAVGFLDGQTRWISLADADEMYKNDDTARREMGVGVRPTPRALPNP